MCVKRLGGECCTFESRAMKRVFRKSEANGPKRWYLNIDAIEERERLREHFAPGLCSCKLFWVFLLTSAFGVFSETLFWYLRTGKIESRSTFVWAPLNMVYGVGGVIMTVILYRVRKRSVPLIFLIGMFVGCFVEFACSYIQERVFSSVSWHYSDLMDIQGRTNLKYAFFWGVLSLFLLGFMYPVLSASLLKIPRNTGRILTVILLVYISINIGVTFFAVRRWAERKKDTQPVFTISRVLDQWFPDDFMEQLFPNLRFVSTEDKSHFSG